jgi:hypothetical protein
MFSEDGFGMEAWIYTFLKSTLDIKKSSLRPDRFTLGERAPGIYWIWGCVGLKADVDLLTYLLTELSPSWEAANFAATQELPSILWDPKVHHRVHKSPPLVPIQSQIDLVHTTPSYLSKIYFNVVHPPTSWSY